MRTAGAEGLEALEIALSAPELMQIAVAISDPSLRDGFNDVHRSIRCNAILSRQHQAVSDHVSADKSAINDLPSIVRDIYIQVLDSISVEPNDNFFNLGGDSLLAVQISLELSRRLPEKSSVSISDIFKCPTINELSQ